ncbi:serine hydrolase domain-containing protein [Sinomicrobium soli]|uniref:serine hydrolase domain-containing protein n=1 Tax=Sinomicrobium sp. N-1-3-6 TaxID=2219864 RepID=UPI001374A687|nr:serine hydrolase domain-containing protein [Sinomicrobium sp. N-1-3-6]
MFSTNRLKSRMGTMLMAFVLIVGFGACSKEGLVKPPPSEEGGLEQIDDMVYRYMSKNAVPGATLAITRDGKLVFAGAYGFADSESGDLMTVDTRSRISSVSKSITSIAIMKLLEEGKLDLDDRIFGDGGILGNDFGTPPYPQHVAALTVKHCLSHHVGGWSNNNSDPTMQQNQLNAQELISYIIDNVPLSNPPGTSYAYSNVGFMILGRVIEKLTQKSYEQYVREEILEPIGITTMEIGGNTLGDQKPDESRYHSSNAYNYNFERRDANGGWIATASDLVRLLVHVDGISTVPDILESTTVQTMTTPPFGYQRYALGFFVNGSTWYHGGSFPGSRSHWMRTGSGICAAIMVNGDATDLEGLLEDIVAAPVEWPDEDLF